MIDDKKNVIFYQEIYSLKDVFKLSSDRKFWQYKI